MAQITTRPTFSENPHFHLAAYGINNPVVQWAIERGAYQPALCPDCRGEGFERGRYGHKLYVEDELGRRPKTCQRCDGTGRRPDRRLHVSDFGDGESRRVFERAFPALRVEGHKPECPLFTVPSRPPSRCVCRLR